MKLEYYGGDGYGGCPEIGEYTVNTDTHNRDFESLSKAREYFDSLNEAKSIWDNKRVELLDAYSELNEDVEIIYD